MTKYKFDQADRWQEIRYIHEGYRNWYDVVGGFGFFLIFGLIGLVMFASDQFGYGMNTYTEILGVLLTLLVIDRQAKLRAEDQFREDLILQMGSPNNAFAREAVRKLAAKRWLYDGSLQRKEFTFSDLHKAYLYEADLSKTRFTHVNFIEANLTYANLADSELSHTDMRGCYLINADLSNTSLRFVDLTHARLNGANLNEADLMHCILPDGTDWSPERDLSEFTGHKAKPNDI